MPRRCCIPNCNSNRAGSNEPRQWTHEFPRNEVIRNEWTEIVRKLKRKKKWSPGPNAVVCIKHFVPKDFIKCALDREKKYVVDALLADAIPSIFPAAPAAFAPKEGMAQLGEPIDIDPDDPEALDELPISNKEADHLVRPSTSGASSSTSVSTSKGKQKEPVVIVLDDDEDTKQKKKKQKQDNSENSGKCINFECPNKKAHELYHCPEFAKTYYKSDNNLHICGVCLEVVISQMEDIAGAVAQGIHIYNKPIVRTNQYVAISDSEDDASDEDIPVKSTDDDDIDLIYLQDNLAKVLNETYEKYGFEDQINESVAILTARHKKTAAIQEELRKDVQELETKLDTMRNNLYRHFRPHITSQPAIEMNDIIYIQEEHRTDEGTDSQPSGVPPPVLPPADLPPLGPIPKVEIKVGMQCYAVKQSMFGAWVLATVQEITPPASDSGAPSEMTGKFRNFKVKYEGKVRTGPGVKTLSGRQVASADPCPVRLVVGQRIIAMFKDDHKVKKETYYCGVIAEPANQINRYRYLVFFDDGYTQYVTHNHIRQIAEFSDNVWEDIHVHSRQFIKTYVENYPERPLVKLMRGQNIKTEWSGKWWHAKVVEVDVSLVKMHFINDSRNEWIYRGSSRLAPLFLEIQAASNRQDGRHRTTAGAQQKKKNNMPYVEYTRNIDADVEIIDVTPPVQTAPNRAVAKKSTRTSNDIVTTLPGKAPVPAEPGQGAQGKVVYYTAKVCLKTENYRIHTCSPACLPPVTFKLDGYNPLTKPLLIGFQRELAKFKAKKMVLYRTPCGLRMRNMSELHSYLLTTNCDLGVDCFDFDHWVHCLAEFILDRYNIAQDDISQGAENMPIPCVNYFDHTLPEYSAYSTVRIPTEGVNLNLDPEFLCGCDCSDDCQDKSKCACFKLTSEGARVIQPNLPDDTIGYVYRRLPEPVSTGIYECNARCKCKKTCLNRVAQFPLALKLQLFKTANRGWGIRCLNDIPQGAFICIYAGNLLTEQIANAGGPAYGDEYFAELDYIEVVEKLKEGFETDVTEPSKNDSSEQEEEDEEDIPYKPSPESDEEFNPGFVDNPTTVSRELTISTRLRTRKKRGASNDDSKDEETSEGTSDVAEPKPAEVPPEPVPTKSAETTKPSTAEDDSDYITISDDDEVREPTSFAPASNLEDEYAPKHSRQRSVRKMFGEDELCYVMDAKKIGNIGRYLNHSCNPNVFVQNVFVDTHDLRFPWVAFFALTFIRAGTELTWNYNYDVNSVPGKVLYCQCGSHECRGRLL